MIRIWDETKCTTGHLEGGRSKVALTNVGRGTKQRKFVIKGGKLCCGLGLYYFLLLNFSKQIEPDGLVAFVHLSDASMFDFFYAGFKL